MLRPITIHPVLNGFRVTIGCQEVVYVSREKLVADLHAYLLNPEEFEKKFLENDAVNRRHVFDVPHPAVENRSGLGMERTPDWLRGMPVDHP